MLTQVTDAAGRVVRFSYRQGLLTSLSLPDGRAVGYEYSGGRLTRVTDLRGGTTAYAYDASGRLVSVADQRGNVIVRNTYGATGRVVQQTDALGNVTTFSWDPTFQETTITDPRGNRWVDRYRGGVLISQTDPLGNRTVFIHDAALNLVEFTDPAGRTWRMTYDDRGNLLSRTAPTPLSFVERWTYTAANDIDTYTDPRGNVTDYDYDARWNLVTMTQPLATITRFGRDAATGLVTGLTDPRGKTWTYEYDSRGRLVGILSPLGDRTTLTYDAGDRLVSKVEPRGNAPGNQPSDYTWRYTYDAADNLTSVTSPLGSVTRYGYDAAGNLISVTDPKGRVTGYEYDAAGRLVRIVAPDGSATTYAYDAAGNLIRRTDAEGRIWQFVYDAANRLASVTSPTGRVWSYAYTPTGVIRSKTLPSGNATPEAGDGTITYSYDAADRLTRIDHSDATPDVTFTYDASSNVISMVDGMGTESYAYDALDRMTEVRRGTDVFSYTYDAAGNVGSRTYPGGTRFTYGYDDEGRLASVTVGVHTTTYAYDEAGNLLRRTLPPGNGYVEVRRYDRDGRLVEVTSRREGAVLMGALYTLDEVGNPIRVESPGGVVTYRYDPARDFLVEACFQASCPSPSDPFVRFSYDRVGNRLSEQRPEGTTAYTYDADDRLLSTSGPSGSVSYTHDLNGNVTGVGNRSYGYDLQNRMTTAVVGGATTTYAYDGLGRRLRATSGGTTVRFLWDPNWSLPMLALERDGAGTVLRRYAYADGPLSVRAGGAEHFLHRDALGSVVGVTSASGEPEWSFAYEPFGTVRSSSQLSPSAPLIPLGFAGEYRDGETGLLHLRARAYAPALGRFLQPDPMPPALRDPYLATYVYVANRPTVLTDPSGECFFVCAIIGAGAGALTYAATVALDDRVGWSWKGFAVATVGGGLVGFTGGAASALGLGVVRTALVGGITSAGVSVVSAGVCGTPLPGAGDLATSFLQGAGFSALGRFTSVVAPSLSRSVFYQGKHLPADYLTGTEASIVDVGLTTLDAVQYAGGIPLGASCK
jgi:RHS repeat-associated protein